MGRQILKSALKMLIYANSQNLRMVDAKLFCHQKKRNVKFKQSQGRTAANNFALV